MSSKRQVSFGQHGTTPNHWNKCRESMFLESFSFYFSLAHNAFCCGKLWFRHNKHGLGLEQHHGLT